MPRATVRKLPDGTYRLEVFGPNGRRTTTDFTSLVAALSAEPRFQEAWRPAKEGDALYVVPD